MLDAIKIFNNFINEKVIHIHEIMGGLTNQAYYVETLNNTYLMRIPGEGTNTYIDRKSEADNLRMVNKLSFIPKIYYSNSETGILITKYILKSRECNINDISDKYILSQINQTLVKLHNSEIKFNNEFDIVNTINLYKNILKKMNVDLPELIKENENVFTEIVALTFEKYPKKLVTCHIDPKLSNFLYANKSVFLIDWEYSGMADQYFDLANFSLTNSLDDNQEELFLNNYVGLSKLKFNKEKFILYKIITDYLWSFWHLIKLNQNEDTEYNSYKWEHRILRALDNVDKLKSL